MGRSKNEATEKLLRVGNLLIALLTTSFLKVVSQIT